MSNDDTRSSPFEAYWRDASDGCDPSDKAMCDMLRAWAMDAFNAGARSALPSIEAPKKVRSFCQIGSGMCPVSEGSSDGDYVLCTDYRKLERELAAARQYVKVANEYLDETATPRSHVAAPSGSLWPEIDWAAVEQLADAIRMGRYWEGEARKAREALSAIAAPKGWKLVPEQWTSEMAHAGYEVHKDAKIQCAECGDIYKAMLAAAPEPEAQ